MIFTLSFKSFAHDPGEIPVKVRGTHGLVLWWMAVYEEWKVYHGTCCSFHEQKATKDESCNPLNSRLGMTEGGPPPTVPTPEHTPRLFWTKPGALREP